MNVFESDPVSQLAFSVHENRGVYALLLGSGISKAAGIPTGWEITLDLVRRMAAQKGITDQTDWASWYFEQQQKEANYSDLVGLLAKTRDERRSILHSYIEPSEEEQEEGLKVPTAAHRAIASLVRSGHFKVLITTNFDRLLETALRDEGVEPTVILSPDTLEGAEPITHTRCYVLKLHGDYKDARILNTEDELSAYPDAYNSLLDRIFDEYGLIVAGWSGQWDEALRSALFRVRSRRYPTYWAYRGELRDEALDLQRRRSAIAVPIESADQFFHGLKERVETLDRSRRVRPDSLELLVKTTKRYISRPEYRVELSDLIEGQLDRLTELLESESLSRTGTYSREEFTARIDLYEELTKPLCYIFGILGRFGDGTEITHVERVLAVLTAHAENWTQGLRAWLDIRAYPAVLLFTAYGLALTSVRRFRDLKQLFDIQLHWGRDGTHRAAQSLLLWGWKGGDPDRWKGYIGLERRHTPLSDHLCTVFSKMSREISGPVPDFELLFERFELLAGLSIFGQYDKASMEEHLLRSDDPRAGFSVPAGRMGWDRERRQHLYEELDQRDLQGTLFEAGFAQGDPDIIDLFKKNFDRRTHYMGF